MTGVDLVIKAVDGVNPDPVVDATCYKRGDIVIAYPLGTFREPNSNELFFFVRIPDMELAEAQALCIPVVDANGVMTLRRRFFCAENIKPESVDYFYQCVTNGSPFVTNRLDFLSWSVTDKVD